MDFFEPPIILWCGRFFTQDGYGTAARLQVGALRELGAPVVPVDIASRKVFGPVPEHLVLGDHGGGSLNVRATDPSRPITAIVHDRPDIYPQVTVTGRARSIGYSYWETVDLPSDWAGWMTSMDRVWASSEFNARAFTDAGVPEWMIDSVGLPADPIVIEAATSSERSRMRWPESTVFLSVVSSLVGRRDLNLLLEAFSIAFDADDDVALVLKVPPDGREHVRDSIDRLASSIPARRSGTWSNIYTVDANLTREQLVRLHGSVDCYVSCERGDGWDLPAMDSLLLGVPVVTSDFGASSTFIDDSDCFIVPTSTKMVSCDASLRGEWSLYNGHLWPYVDPYAFAEQLRRVHVDPQSRRSAGQHAAVRMRTEYDSRSTASGIVERLSNADSVLYRSDGPAVVTIADDAGRWESRSYLPVADDPRLREARLLADLLDARFDRALRPDRLLVAYQSAARTAISQPADFLETETRKAISKTMSTSSRQPLQKYMAIRGFAAEVPELARQFGDPEDLRRTLETVDEYLEAQRGGESSAAADEILEGRRELWERHGPFAAPPEDQERLESLSSRYRGKRVFILGDDPSVLDCDLELLADEFTFGVDKIHLLFDRISWRPNFYTFVDWQVGAAVRDQMHLLDGIIKFFPDQFRGILGHSEDVYWYGPRGIGEHIDDQFERNIAKGIPSGSTVLATAIQQAFYMGFRDIYVLGVGAARTTSDSARQGGPAPLGTGTRLQVERAMDDDPNHYGPTYVGGGRGGADTDPVGIRRRLLAMRKGVERHGGRLLNATAGGELHELERVEFESLFE